MECIMNCGNTTKESSPVCDDCHGKLLNTHWDLEKQKEQKEREEFDKLCSTCKSISNHRININNINHKYVSENMKGCQEAKAYAHELALRHLLRDHKKDCTCGSIEKF